MINEFKYGFFKVDKKDHYGDIKLIDGGVKQWSTREGFKISVEDIKDILKTKPEMVLIGTGASGLLKISEGVEMEIRGRKVRLQKGKTMDMCELYNKLEKEGKKVNALLCATC